MSGFVIVFCNSHGFFAADLQVSPALALPRINLHCLPSLPQLQDTLTVHKDIARAAQGLGNAPAKIKKNSNN